MAAKKPKTVPLEQYSKSALIALVKKLQREVTRLKALVDVPPLKPALQLQPLPSNEDTPETVAAELQYFDEHAERFAEAHKPFPWEKK